jgi:hypothetical protein
MQEYGMWKHVLTLTLLFCPPAVQSQSQPMPVDTQAQKRALPAGPEVHPTAMDASWVDPHQQLARTLVANAFVERQLALRRDTAKLLTLAAELKQNVDKTSPSILSIEVIKKAQEIEKLAKSVKDKMKDAY